MAKECSVRQVNTKTFHVTDAPSAEEDGNEEIDWTVHQKNKRSNNRWKKKEISIPQGQELNLDNSFLSEEEIEGIGSKRYDLEFLAFVNLVESPNTSRVGNKEGIKKHMIENTSSCGNKDLFELMQ